MGMVLTKEELYDQDWWNKNIVFVERIPADDISYETLLSVFVGSYYVDVRTLNSEVPQNVIAEDLVNTTNAIVKLPKQRKLDEDFERKLQLNKKKKKKKS